MTNIVIFFGPIGHPKTGQSLASDSWLLNTVADAKIVNTNFQNLSKILKIFRFFLNFFQILYFSICNRNSNLYISAKRTRTGLLTDLILLILHYLICRGNRVVHIHGSDFDDICSKRFFLYLFTCFFSMIDEVIVLSSGMSKPFRDFTSCRIQVISNFSSVHITKEEMHIKIDSFIDDGVIDICFLSNIIYTKGIIELIRAIELLNSSSTKFKLHIAGNFISDNYKTKLQMKQFIEKHISSNDIIYHGVVSGEQKRNLILKTRILALPTYYKSEAQPLAILEGLSCGNAIVTTRHNHNADFLSEFDVNFCTVKNVNSLCDALLSAKDQIILGSHTIVSNQQKALRHFSEEKFSKSIDASIFQKKNILNK